MTGQVDAGMVSKPKWERMNVTSVVCMCSTIHMKTKSWRVKVKLLPNFAHGSV